MHRERTHGSAWQQMALWNSAFICQNIAFQGVQVYVLRLLDSSYRHPFAEAHGVESLKRQLAARMIIERPSIIVRDRGCRQYGEVAAVGAEEDWRRATITLFGIQCALTVARSVQWLRAHAPWSSHASFSRP
jgi:hypothetical protein